MGFKPLTYNTPPEEEAHIFAEDDAAIFQSIFGEDGVFAIGDRMKATVINNNQVRVGNGILCVGGHIGRTVYGDYSDMTIENGEISKNRNDIITAVFSTTGEKGIDEFKIEVKKGTPGVVAEDPELTKENLYEGGKLREFPLWRVKLEGINIIGVEQMFKIIPKIPDLEEKIELLNGKIDPPSDSDIFLTGYAGGFWTGGGKNLCFSLPVAYNLSNIKKVIPTKISLTSRQAGSYCYGGADGHEAVNLKTDIVKIDSIKDMSQLNFSITFPTVRAKTNNDATGVSYSIFLKLQDF